MHKRYGGDINQELKNVRVIKHQETHTEFPLSCHEIFVQDTLRLLRLERMGNQIGLQSIPHQD